MQHHSVRLGLPAFLVLAALLAILVAVAACGGTAAQPTATAVKPGTTATKPAASPAASPAAKTVPGGTASAGPAAISKYGCGGCHTIPGVQGANGTTAPNLGGFANRAQIAGTVPNTPENLVKWIQDPPSVKSDTRMPKLNVTEQDSKDIAAYLYTLN